LLAALRTVAKGSADLSAMSSSEWRPSEKFRTHNIAISSSAGLVPPVFLYRPRRPSCGSPLGHTFVHDESCSRISIIASAAARESSSASAVTNPVSSADVWYSANRPLGVLVRHPTGRSKPGEQY